MGDSSSDESGDHELSSAGVDFDNDDRPPSDFDALEGAPSGGHPYYDHFLDPHSNTLNEPGGSSSDAGTTGDPMSTLEERLAHQTLLDDDELAEGQFSLPKSLEFPGLEAVVATAHDEVASPESSDTVVLSPREELELIPSSHQQAEKVEPPLMQELSEVFRSAPFPIPLKQRIHMPPPPPPTGAAWTAPVTIPMQPKCAPPSNSPSPPDLVDFEEDGDEETSFAGKPASRSSSRASSSGAKRIPAKLKMKLERPVPPVKEPPPPAVPPKTRKLKSKKVEVTSFVNNSFQVEVED